MVVRRDTAAYEKPDTKSTSNPVTTFDFFYVLPPEKGAELKVEPEKPDAALKDGFFRVSTSDKDKDEFGWIAKDDVVVWPHRQAIQMRPIAGRKRAEFFKTDKDLKSTYTGAASAEPLSREPTSGAGTSLMPLLAEFKIKNPSGDEINGYHVAYLHERAKTGGSAGTPSAATVNIKAATLDIVFVIDTSASMQPMIDATKDVVGELAKRLADDPAKTAPVRFGLVAYRDRINARDPSWYITKTFWELNRTAETSPDAVGKGTDISEFLNVLGSVTAGEISSEDTPEDVLGGLREAVRLPGWNPNGYKHIVLIGDASGHVDGDDVKNPEKLTIDGLKAMMQPSGKDNVGSKIICHAIRILGEDMSDWPKCEAQFAKLAEGVDFNGLYATFKKGEKADFTDKLVDLINKSRESLKPFITGEATAAVPAASPAPGGSSPAPAAAGTAAPGHSPRRPAGLRPLARNGRRQQGRRRCPHLRFRLRRLDRHRRQGTGRAFPPRPVRPVPDVPVHPQSVRERRTVCRRPWQQRRREDRLDPADRLHSAQHQRDDQARHAASCHLQLLAGLPGQE